MAAAVTGFEDDANRNRASFVIGFLDSRSINPCASKWIICPFRATMVTAPDISWASTWRITIWWILSTRSEESPTSSGLEPAAGAAIRVSANDAEVSTPEMNFIPTTI